MSGKEKRLTKVAKFQIDKLVYKLYSLTKEEIKIVEETNK
jgi:hypothetical protein